MSLCSTLTDLIKRVCPSPPPPRPSRYVSTPLVSDGTITAPFTDPNLKNGWGVAFNPNGFVWVSAADSGKSTLYDGTGKPQALVVTIAPAAGGTQGSPTGIVFSGSADFTVTDGVTTGPSRFIFATEDGTISGWAPNVDGTHSIIAVDNSASGAGYTGLALAGNGGGNFLYAANFKGGQIDMFGNTFNPIIHIAPIFIDPTLPAGYYPFGIQNIQGDLYVTFAKRKADGDEETGPGLGYVSVFDTGGKFLRRIASGGTLNAPWGLAMAPANFGTYSNTLLVGNFGDGHISSYDARTGEYLGQLTARNGRPVLVDGLWGMQFGNGIQNQPANTLFYAAGPNDEEGGLYGRIDAAIT